MQKQEVNELTNMFYGESVWRDRAIWQLNFCWFPKRCHITKRFLWLKMAYCGTVMYTGPGEAVLDFRWHDMDEHLIWLLKA